MHFRVNQEPGQISALAHRVEDYLGGLGMSAQTIRNVNLCLVEIIVNTIDYGMKDRTVFEVLVDIDAVEEGLVVEIVDDADPFDPTAQAPTPDLDAAMVD